MIGKQLKALRVRMGLTQAQLAERLKVTGNSVARMERGEVLITEPMALLISYVANAERGQSARRKLPKTRNRGHRVRHGRG